MTIFENLLKFNMLTMYSGIKHSFEVLSFAFTNLFRLAAVKPKNWVSFIKK